MEQLAQDIFPNLLPPPGLEHGAPGWEVGTIPVAPPGMSYWKRKLFYDRICSWRSGYLRVRVLNMHQFLFENFWAWVPPPPAGMPFLERGGGVAGVGTRSFSSPPCGLLWPAGSGQAVQND